MAPAPYPRTLIGIVREMPVSRKLLVITTVTTAVALLFAGLGIIAIDTAFFRINLRRDLSALVRIVGDNSAAAVLFDDAAVAEGTLSVLRARTHVVEACLYREDGTILARYQRSQSATSCPGASNRNNVRSTPQGLVASYRIVFKGQAAGRLALLYDLGEEGERARLYGADVLGILIAASLVAFALSSRLSGLITKPISQLVRTATSVSETKDYNIRAPEIPGEEFGTLVNAFNQMLDGIQSRDSEVRSALVAKESALGDAQSAGDFLATTLTSIGDAVIVTDVNGRAVLANRAAHFLLGADDAAIKDQPLSQLFTLIDEMSRDKVMSLTQQVLRDGIVAELSDLVLILNDGTETPVDSSIAPILDQTGNAQGAVLVFRDVRSRRRADEISRLLASIVQSSDDAIIGHTLDGAITSWNEGAARVFGYSREEMLGKTTAALAPPAGDEMPAVLERIRQGERVEQYYALRRTKTGSLIDVSIAVSPVYDALGRMVGASKIARDVTAQVRAAERLERLNADLRRSNENLSRSNEDLERFAFIASHDFQEPLRMISIYSQLLVKSYSGKLDEKAAAFVENIVSGTQRIRDLLADLLAYTEVGVGQEKPPEVIDLNAVLELVKQNLRGAIENSAAEIIADRLPLIRGSAAHFVALFQNLIGNAIKYRGEAPPRITISAQDRAGSLLFSVADNGIGIDPAYHDKIFVAFKRLHGKQIPGTGIGLAICHRVVDRYDGKIWVDSQIGRGAKFLFTIPNKWHVADSGDEPT